MLLDAVAEDEPARAFFGALPYSLQRHHAHDISAVQTEQTEQRRVQRALRLFRDGKNAMMRIHANRPRDRWRYVSWIDDSRLSGS